MLPGRRTFNGALFGSNQVPPPGTPLVGGIAVSPAGVIYMDGLGLAWDPAQLYVNSEQGCWYDGSDLSNMFQDAAGTVPVTAVEQPVGRINDKSGNGNHATQAAPEKRPVLSARVNQLLESNGFSSGVITPGTGLVVMATGLADQAGNLTARQIRNTTTTEQHRLYQNTNMTGPSSFTVFVKNVDANVVQLSCSGTLNIGWYANFDLSSGLCVAKATTATLPTATMTLVDGFYKCTVTAPSGETSGGNQQFYVLEPGSSLAGTAQNPFYQGTAKSVIVGGASLVPADQASLPYQRVNTATDYDTVGFPHYLKFDGVDDALATASIDFTATDKMSVFAGVRKLSDAAAGVLTELTTTAATTGAFAFFAPISAEANYGLLANRAGTNTGITATTYTSPVTSVLVANMDLTAGSNLLKIGPRINGVVPTFIDTGGVPTAGAGAFANAPLYIGSRAGTSLPLNGHLYQLVVLGRLASPTEIDDTELYIAHKTGVTLS